MSRWWLIILFLIFPARVQALQITRVYPAPLNDQSESVTLTNNSDQTSQLDGWWLQDQLSTPTRILNLAGSLLPSASLTVSIEPDKLNNSGDGVTLFDPTDNQIDSMQYSYSQPGVAWVLTDQGWQLDNEQLTPAVSLTPTSSPPTPLPTSIDYSPHPTPTSQTWNISDLELTEVAACPLTGQSEWLEFYNLSDQDISLFGWKIQDEIGQIIDMDIAVPADSFQIFTLTQNMLNNSGDLLRILDDQNQLRWEVDLPACHAGWSWHKTDNEWVLDLESPGIASTTTPTTTPSSSNSTENVASQPDLAGQNHSSTTPRATGPITNNQTSTTPDPPQPPVKNHIDLSQLTKSSAQTEINDPDTNQLSTTIPLKWRIGPSLNAIMAALTVFTAGIKNQYEINKRSQSALIN